MKAIKKEKENVFKDLFLHFKAVVLKPIRAMGLLIGFTLTFKI